MFILVILMKNMVMENAYMVVYVLKSGTHACLEKSIWSHTWPHTLTTQH